MKIITKIMICTLLFILCSVLVLAAINYRGESIFMGNTIFQNSVSLEGSQNNITNITSVDNIYLGNDIVNHRITDNSTAIIITGDTSTFIIN